MAAAPPTSSCREDTILLRGIMPSRVKCSAHSDCLPLKRVGCREELAHLEASSLASCRLS